MKLTLLMAMTVDGMIARDKDHFPDWTGKADKRMFRQFTMDAGVVIMGARTFKTLGKPLPDRLNVVMTRQPERFSEKENLIFTSDPPEKILQKLSSQGYDHAVLIGGAIINSLFEKAGLIDELIVTIAPVVFGQGLSMFSEPMNKKLELLDRLEIEPGYMVLTYNFL